jgi:hypothetical protein
VPNDAKPDEGGATPLPVNLLGVENPANPPVLGRGFGASETGVEVAEAAGLKVGVAPKVDVPNAGLAFPNPLV